MSPTKSRRNVSPDPQNFEELQRKRVEKELAKSMRIKIQKWPEQFLNLFNEIDNEVNEDHELLKMFEVLVAVKRDLDEGAEGQRQPEAIELCNIVKWLNDIYKSTPYLQNEFETVLREHDQDVAKVINFHLGKYNERLLSVMKPECADLPPMSVLKNDCLPKRAAVPNSSSKSAIPCWTFGIVICIIAVICSMLWKTYLSAPSESTSHITSVEPNKIAEWTQNIKDLQEKFPSQNEKVWFNILSGVKTIVTEKPTKPSVILLLHNDKKTSACLANAVGKEAVKLLSDSFHEPIIIQGEDLKLNESLAKDYGLFTESYKDDIEKKHVMIVLDLQEVPGMVAQTFHVLCDVENPLVRNAAFLFTMEVDEKLKQKPTQIAEAYLSRLWRNSLPSEIMDPLITRITNAVVSVNMESHLPC